MKLVKKIAKWSGITLLILIVLILVAPFIFKDKIIQFVKDEANAQLNARVDFGDFDLTLLSSFPDFTLSINNVSIANTGDFAGDTLLSTKNLTATINLMSVISGSQYKIRSVVLDHPRILARVLKDGRANWDITKPGQDTVKKTESAEPAKFDMSLKHFEIKEAHVVYDDKSMDFYTSLNGFNHTLSGDFTQDNFLMETMTSIGEFTLAYGGVTYLKKVKTDIKADLDADMPNFKFTFKDNKISLNELGLGINGFFAMPGNDMNMDINFKAEQSEFKNFLSLIPSAYSADFASVKTSGKLAFDGFVKGTYNDKLMPAFAVNMKIDDAMFQYPSLPASAQDIAVDVKVNNPDGNPDKTVIDVRKFHVELAGNPVDAVLHVETPVSDPLVNGSVLGKVNLATLKDVLPLSKDENLNGTITADVKMNGRMSSIERGQYDKFQAEGKVIVMDMQYKSKDNPYDVDIKSMTLNFTPRFVELAGFDSRIGRNDVQADGKIENFMQYMFKDELLKGNFSMSSSLMDLNQFMSSAETTPTAAPSAPDTAALGVIEVPSNIDFTLNTKIAKMIYEKLEMSNIAGNVTIRDSKINLSELKMNALGGSMRIYESVYETSNPKSPGVSFKMNIRDFDIPSTYNTFPIVQQLATVAKYTTGRFSTDISYTSSLDATMMPVMSSLNGEGNLKTSKVVVSGFEPLSKLADELKMDKFKKTEFSDLNINYKIKDGKITLEEFPFKSNSVTGFINGYTAFDQSISYLMKMEVPTKDMPPGAKQHVTGLLSKASMLGVNAQLPEKVKLNALFGGTVMKPTIKTDVKDIAQNVVSNVTSQVKDTIKQTVTNVVNDAKAELEAKKKKIMDDAAREAQKVKDEAAKLAEQTKTEGYKKADELQNKGGNPIEKAANKKLAEKLRKETDEKAAKIVSEGNAKADNIMKEAQKKADEIK
ncbi:MAG: AsmA family protein [Bacteroidota bacterium]